MSGSLQPLVGYGAAAYKIANSLRFRSSASAYLSRTPSVAGNQQKFSLNLGVKRGVLGASETFFYAGGNSTYWFALSFNASNQLQVVATTNAGATAIEIYTNAVFRDPSAWYLITIIVDTTNATAANRVLIYVNGVSQSLAITTSPTQNQALSVNSAVIHTFGVLNYASTSYFDGYMAEVNFIDGQALTPSSFGAFDATSGVWQATRYSGTYGTNGFYLKFSDTTSTTTLCYDYSGNSNNWTPNNISLTAGSTYDSMLDSPTNYDNGGTGVGNYAVLNPLSNLYGSTISNGNLTGYCSSAQSGVSGTIKLNSGSWYYEYTVQGTGSPGRNWIGYLDDSNPQDTNSWSLGSKALLYANDGTSAVTYGAYGASYTTGDVIGVAFNVDTGTITFYKNGVSQGNLTTGVTGTNWRPAVTYGATGWTGSINFGQRPFAYTPPTGYKALNTQNLSAPSIVNGANYMAATLWTGDGASPKSFVNAVNGVSFQPDLVWIKMRSGAYQHVIADSVRGGNAILHSNSTSAEDVNWQYGYLQSFNSNGFTAQAGSTSIENINLNGSTFVGWQWKAGGTAVTNNVGSITSQVSANTTSGFAVVTYTGTGSNATVGHGLGVAPSMVIVKSRSSGADNWQVYSLYLTSAAYRLRLNSTDAQDSQPTMWNSTAPTATVFSVGTASGTNASSYTYVAYCFAAIPGYSAFGSYTGNGSADGPFAYTGFRPRYLLIKNSNAASQWRIADTSRSPYNQSIYSLRANDSTAENSTNCDIDFLSNGFKIRGTGTDQNDSGNVYVFAAFAENPFTNALAR